MLMEFNGIKKVKPKRNFPKSVWKWNYQKQQKERKKCLFFVF